MVLRSETAGASRIQVRRRHLLDHPGLRPGGRDHYLITLVCSDKDDKKTAEAREAIMESVKGLKKDDDK